MKVENIVDELASVMDRSAAEKLGRILTSLYSEMQESAVIQRLTALERSVEQLTLAVTRLTEAQNRLQSEFAEYRLRTDARLDRIEQAIAELAEAQKRTEETVARLGQRVEELSEDQKSIRAEIAEVWRVIRELAELQRSTEKYLREKQDALAKQLGGLSFSVGYSLENEAYRSLPPLLERDYGLVTEERLKREMFEDATGQIEVNIYGRARRNGEQVTIVGESKVQLSRKDVEQFVKRKLRRLQRLFGKVFPVLVTHMTSQIGVKEYANSLGVAVYYSYEF